MAALRDELGPQFEQSMRVWCGLQPAPYALDTWQVEIAHTGAGEPLGVLGYYRHPDDRPGRFWVGWLGVVPTARRQGIGGKLLRRVEVRSQAAGANELWVYTEADNQAAAAFYLAHGMTPHGRFSELGLPQAAATADSVVFFKRLP